MRAQVDEQCVIKANSQFWEQMLAMTVEPAPVPKETCVDAGHLLGSVDLTGAWKGRIEVRLAEGLAYLATGTMLMQAVETVVEAEPLGATKEIANMNGGSNKTALP